MTKFFSAIGVVTALTTLTACSKESTGPQPGSWQATIGGMTNAFTPTRFTFAFATVSSTQQVAPLPAMTYNGEALDAVGSTDFGLLSKDSVMAYGQLIQLLGDTLVGVRQGQGSPGCNTAFFLVAFDSARDSVNGSVRMLDGSNGFNTCDQGTFSAVKR